MELGPAADLLETVSIGGVLTSMSDSIHDLFPRALPVIAVLHVGPSPGVPGAVSVQSAVDRAVAETRLLLDLGVDGLLVENAHDAPALGGDETGPEVVAYMTCVAVAVRRYANRLPVGVRILNSDCAALAVAHAAGCHFIRVDGWASNPVAAGRFHRYRKAVGSERLPVFADVRPRHAGEVEALVTETEAARPDALVVLGPAVGRAPEPAVVEAARGATGLPLFCGGGLGAENLDDYTDTADGFLVGSGLKEQRRWQAPVSEEHVRALIGAVEYARGQEVRQ